MPLAVLITLLLAQAGKPAANDWTVVPGVRVGPITAGTVRGDVDRLFHAGAVEDDEIELDEGMLQAATLVYRHDASATVAITWNGKGREAHPKQVFICQGQRRGTCRWHAAGGIAMGARLSDLEALNGRPFTVSGFGYNYGGNVLSWDGGALKKLDCHGRLILTLDGERTGGRYTVPMTAEEVHAVRGDRPIRSSTPAMRKLNPRVVGMLFEFASPDSKPCE